MFHVEHAIAFRVIYTKASTDHMFKLILKSLTAFSCTFQRNTVCSLWVHMVGGGISHS